MADVFTPELDFGVYESGIMTPTAPAPPYRTIMLTGGYGPELVTIPYGGTPTGSWTITASEIKRNGDAGAGQAQITVVTGQAGKTYRISFTASGWSGDAFSINYAGSNVGQLSANGDYLFPAHTGSGGGLAVIDWSAATGQVTVTNLSVKEVL